MNEPNPVLLPAQGGQPEIVKLGTVAAQNIVLALELPQTAVQHIETAITDEINAMSSHFALAFADIRDQYEIEVAKIKSGFKFVEANATWIVVAALALFAAGVFIGIYA